MRSHSVDAVAELVSEGRKKPVHRETVLTWIRNGELRAVNLSESANSKRPRYVIPHEALIEFLERRSTTKSSPVSAKSTSGNAAARLVAGRDYVAHYKE